MKKPRSDVPEPFVSAKQPEEGGTAPDGPEKAALLDDRARREFMLRVGKYALYTAPVVTHLLSRSSATAFTSPA
jgi:hypothetical protein